MYAVGDITTTTLRAALNGLAAQRQAHQRNVANMETPGYLADRVEFDDSLRRALDRGAPGTAVPVVSSSLAPTNLQGNNVQVDLELTELSANGVRQQLVVEALSSKYRLLRTAIGGS